MKKIMMMSVIFALLSISIVVIGADSSVDNRTPIDRYHGDTQIGLEMSRLKFKKFMLTNLKSDFDDFSSETEVRQKEVKESLKEALSTIKNTKAQDALKTYHVAVMTALKSIPFSLDERAISYEQRQRALEDKVTEAWERFEIER